MKYHTTEPVERLQPFIRYFWSLESGEGSAFPTSFRTIADGCPGLLFQHTDKGTLFQHTKELPATFLFGQSTAHAALHVHGRFSATGICFYPHALASLFGMNASLLTDSCMDLDDLARQQGFYLSEQLAMATDANERVAILTAFLLLQLNRRSLQQDPRMQAALSEIVRSNGTVPLRHLQEQLQLSERSFERHFKQYIGISPKLFSRICRFQASLSQLRSSNYEKLSDIAFEHDYADQSHFIRSFKEFAGFSPLRYQHTSEVAENLAVLR